MTKIYNELEIYHLIKENTYLKIHPSVFTIYQTFKRYPLNKKINEKSILDYKLNPKLNKGSFVKEDILL